MSVHLIDGDTGLEIGRTASQRLTREQLVIANAELQNKLTGAALQVGEMRARLEDKAQDDAAGQPDVRQVADYWARRAEEDGWWSRLPRVKPGDERWGSIAGRLKERWGDGEKRTVLDCYLAVEGALMQDRKRTKREWVDAASIFRNSKNFELHYERAKDPSLELVRSKTLILPDGVGRKDAEDALKVCDCGHPLYRHHKQLDGPLPGWWPCDRCGCVDWSDQLRRSEELLRSAA